MNPFVKNTFVSLAAFVALATVVTITNVVPVAAQNTTAIATTPGGKGDYLVQIGKHPIWASTLPKAGVASPVFSATAPGRDYLVHVGKRTDWASSLPKPDAVALPSVQTPSCRDYPVTVGKRTVLASSLPQNRNADGSSRFCCITSADCKHAKSCCPA